MKDEQYKVGFKKPPPDHQFKPGQSGNPRGRPRGATSFKSDLAAELAQEVVVVEDGRRRKVTKQRAFVQSLISSALKNDKTAMNTLLAYLRAFGGENDEAPDVEDEDMIKRYLDRKRAQNVHQDNPNSSSTSNPKKHGS